MLNCGTEGSLGLMAKHIFTGKIHYRCLPMPELLLLLHALLSWKLQVQIVVLLNFLLRSMVRSHQLLHFFFFLLPQAMYGKTKHFDKRWTEVTGKNISTLVYSFKGNKILEATANYNHNNKRSYMNASRTASLDGIWMHLNVLSWMRACIWVLKCIMKLSICLLWK